MDLQLAGKTVVITGANGGIGRALAEAFAAEGASLGLLAGRSGAELEAFAAARPWGARAAVAAADVRDPRALGAAFALSRERFGRLDVCIANAGIWPAEPVPLHRMEDARIADVLAVDLLGAIYTAREFLRALAATGPRGDGHGAALVLVGSTAGRFGEAGHAEYAAAKAGLEGLLRTLKNEIVALDPFGRVALLEPGWTVTELTRASLGEAAIRRAAATMALEQFARPEDVAAAAVALASPALSRHVSGQVVTVAGGMEGRLLRSPEAVDVERVRARLAP